MGPAVWVAPSGPMPLHKKTAAMDPLLVNYRIRKDTNNFLTEHGPFWDATTSKEPIRIAELHHPSSPHDRRLACRRKAWLSERRNLPWNVRFGRSLLQDGVWQAS